MALPIFPSTAEDVILVSGAIVVLQTAAIIETISSYTNLSLERTERALELSVELGLLRKQDQFYVPKDLLSEQLCKQLRTPNVEDSVAVLRIIIQLYEPLIIFLEELQATGEPMESARRTKERLDLVYDQSDIKDTLWSLATYSGALKAGSGNSFVADSQGESYALQVLARGSKEESGAIAAIREVLGENAASKVSHVDVIVPLANALQHASRENAAREAVMQASNAIENFLNIYARQTGVSLQGAHGINAILDRLKNSGKLPSKLHNVGKYVGHVRNAADHGMDNEINAAWKITAATGRNFVFVAANLICAILCYSDNQYQI